MAMKRRKFLKTLGAGTAGIAAFSCRDQEAARRIADEQGSVQDVDLTWTKAPCRYCGTAAGEKISPPNRSGFVCGILRFGHNAAPSFLKFCWVILCLNS